MAATLVLQVAYDGAGFSGFAAQEGQGDVRTVAGELDRCLTMLLRGPVQITCAGRTDAGVHARAQYVSMPLTGEQVGRLEDGGAARLLRSLTAVLPDDIAPVRVLRAEPGFSARFDARMRRYRYRISCGPTRPLFSAHWSWWVHASSEGALDVGAMRQAAQALVGEHDFASFCKTASAEGKPTHRFLLSVDLSQEDQFGEPLLAVDVVGNAFLHNMVRIIVGSLVEVGLGRRDPAWMGRALAACDRRAAGPTAPPQGLVFWDVDYPEGVLRAW